MHPLELSVLLPDAMYEILPQHVSLNDWDGSVVIAPPAAAPIAFVVPTGGRAITDASANDAYPFGGYTGI